MNNIINLKTLLLSILLSSSLYANNNMVIYNNNLALIKTTETINKIDKGEGKFKYTNISPNFIIDSVFVKVPNYINVYEENYYYDQINLPNILKYYIDKEVTLYEENTEKEYSGKLLSFNNSSAIVDIENLGIKRINLNDIYVPEINSDMNTIPTLEFSYFSKRTVQNPIKYSLSYLTNGISWNTNYIFNITDKLLSINAKVKITNNTDTSYEQYRLSLVSGNINKVQNQYSNNRRYSKSVSMDYAMVGSSGQNSIQNSKVSNYHIYNLDNKITLKSKSTKQFKLFSINTTDWSKKLRTDFHENFGNQVITKKPKQFLYVNNKQIKKVYPKGKIRIYEDTKRNTLLIGENVLSNTAANKDLEILYGEDYNAEVTRSTIVNFSKRIKNQYKSGNRQTLFREIEYQYNVKNLSDKKKTIRVRQYIPKDNQSFIKLVNNSFQNITKIVKKDNNYIEVEISLKPYDKKTFNFKFKSN